jgi:hypothetical protein
VSTIRDDETQPVLPGHGSFLLSVAIQLVSSTNDALMSVNDEANDLGLYHGTGCPAVPKLNGARRFN